MSGQFFGGAADGLVAGAKSAQELQEEARNQQQQQYTQVNKQITDTVSHIGEIVKAATAAGHDPQEVLKNPAVQALMGSAQQLAQKIGRDPAQITATVNSMAIKPEDPQTHKVVKIGSDAAGNDKYGVLNEGKGTVVPVDQASGQPAAPASVPSSASPPSQPQLPATDTLSPAGISSANPTPAVPVATPTPNPVAPVAPTAAPDAPPSFNQRFALNMSSSANDANSPIPPPKIPDNIPVGTPAAVKYAIDNNITGDEFLNKAIPSEMRNMVKDIADYKIDPKTALTRLKGPERQAILSAVHQYTNGDYDAKYYSSMQKAVNEFISGGNTSPAGQMTAGNVAIQHLATVADGVDKLAAVPGLLAKIAKSNEPILSYAANALKNKSIIGTSEGQALQAFLTARNRYAEEITKFYSGSGGSEAERQRSIDSLDAALSPKELYSALSTESELLHGKVNVLQDRWKTALAGPRLFDATIRRAQPDFPIIQEKSQKSLDRIQAGYMKLIAPNGPGAGGSAPAVVDYKTYFGGAQ